jgi:hypothetical protein
MVMHDMVAAALHIGTCGCAHNSRLALGLFTFRCQCAHGALDMWKCDHDTLLWTFTKGAVM